MKLFETDYASMTGRVAILLRQGREIRMLCPDQDAALRWMKDNWQAGDEWIAIEDEDLNAIRLQIQRRRFFGFLGAVSMPIRRSDAEDVAFLRKMRISLW